MYDIEFTKTALAGIIKLHKSEPICYKKLYKLIEELKIHPKTGTGQPEQLKGFHIPIWLRRISKKHRLVYEIYEIKIRVVILSSYGHYDEK